jgi:hypothetical protein
VLSPDHVIGAGCGFQLGKIKPEICPKRGWRLSGIGTFGVVARVQEVAVRLGELLAGADLIHYTMCASEKVEEEAIRKA